MFKLCILIGLFALAITSPPRSKRRPAQPCIPTQLDEAEPSGVSEIDGNLDFETQIIEPGSPQIDIEESDSVDPVDQVALPGPGKADVDSNISKRKYTPNQDTIDQANEQSYSDANSGQSRLNQANNPNQADQQSSFDDLYPGAFANDQLHLGRPKFIYFVSIAGNGPKANPNGLVHRLLGILVDFKLIDRRTAAFVLAKNGIRGQGTLKGLETIFNGELGPNSPPVPQYKIESLYLRGHPLATVALYYSLSQINKLGVANASDFISVLLRFLLETKVIDAQKAIETAAPYDVSITITAQEPPPPQLVDLYHIPSNGGISSHPDQLPTFLLKILHILAAKPIITITTGSNILATFGVDVVTKYEGKPITSPTQLKISGTPLQKAKFINILYRLIEFKSRATIAKTLSHVVKALLELALDNGVLTPQETINLASTFGITITVALAQKPEDDAIFDLPEPDPLETPEPESAEIASGQQSFTPESSPLKLQADAPPVSYNDASKVPRIIREAIHSKIQFDVKIESTSYNDNQKFIRKLVELAAGAGILTSSDITNDVKLPSVKSDGEATEKFLEALHKYFNDQKDGRKPKHELQNDLIEALLELLLDNGKLSAAGANDLTLANGIKAKIHSSTEVTQKFHSNEDEDGSDD